MSQILIINTPGLENRGGMAVVMGSLRCLRETLPQAEITVLCHHCREDWDTLAKICRRYDVQLKKHPWFKEHDSRLASLLHSVLPAALCVSSCIFGRMAGKAGKRSVFQRSDVILDLNIDALHDNYGIFFPSWALANILLGKIAGKPVVVWSAGIGSFRNRLTRLSAKFVLNRVDLIMAREAVTKDYLESLGVTKPEIHVTADHAFLMEPASPERIHEILATEGIKKGTGPLIGISASQLIPKFAFPGIEDRRERNERYFEVMAKMIDYIVGKLDATVILIPHSTVPTEDDRIASKRIREQVDARDRVRLLTGEYMADEFKGIIGQCEMVIGARMHSTIASSSMGIPTIAVVYGQKSHGIIGTMMGQGDYVVEVAKCSPDELLHSLKAKIDKAWDNREAIRRELEDRSEAVKKRAWLNGTMVRDLLQNDASVERGLGA